MTNQNEDDQPMESLEEKREKRNKVVYNKTNIIQGDMSNIELISLDDDNITLGLRPRVISHPSGN